MRPYCQLTQNAVPSDMMSKTERATRELLDSTDESLASIARRAGVTAGQLSLFVAGGRGLSVRSLERVAAAMGHELRLVRIRTGRGVN